MGLSQELLRHGVEEWLDWFHDSFPGTGGIGVESAFGMGTREFGFGSQHRLEFKFLNDGSQTCYLPERGKREARHLNSRLKSRR